MEAITDQLIIEVENGVGRLVLNRPKKHNAISFEMWQGVSAAVRGFSEDEAVRVIVVSGAGGKAFSSGADISQFGDKRGNIADVAEYDVALQQAYRDLTTVTKPTIASIEGFCIGGGLATALCCDLRIATDTARFAIPAARLGLGYPYTGLRPLVELVGPANAKEIFFTARKFTAPEALRMGLVNRVVSRDDLQATVAELAQSIAENAPFTVRACKTIIEQVMKDEDDRDLALCQRVVDACFASEDYAEGRRAFMEKRRPEFRGV